MTFIQLIEYSTSRNDELNALVDEWLAETEGKRSTGRATMCSDRDDTNRYVEIVEFPSYEDAMANSALPETAAFAERMGKLCDEGPAFRNLDVLRSVE